MPTPARRTVVVQLKALRSGLLALCSTKLFLDGVACSPRDFIPLIDAQLASAEAVTKARGALAEALYVDRKAQAKGAPKLRGLRELLRVMYGSNHAALAPFGLTPRKARTPQTPAALLVRAERVRATRAARGTKGTKQKKAIKGNVER